MNLTRSVYAYECKNGEDTHAKFTASSLEKGAIEIARSLWSKYIDVNKKQQSVNGDMTKVRYVPGLSEEAQVLLTH